MKFVFSILFMTFPCIYRFLIIISSENHDIMKISILAPELCFVSWTVSYQNMEPILAIAIDFDYFFSSHSLVYWQYESKFFEAYVAPVKKIKTNFYLKIRISRMLWSISSIFVSFCASCYWPQLTFFDKILFLNIYWLKK